MSSKITFSPMSATATDAFHWLFAWFAQILQEPRNKPGTAIVFRGGMGVGKTIVGQIFGSLMKRHYVPADDPDI